MDFSIANFNSTQASKNVLTKACNFNSAHTWNSDSNSVATSNESKSYYGLRSLLIIYVDSGVYSTIDYGDDSLLTIIKETGNYIFALRLFKEDDSVDIDFRIKLVVNGIVTTNTTFNANVFDSSGYNNSQWTCYFQNIELTEDDEVDFIIETRSDSVGAKLYVDGMKLELDDRGLGYPSIYTEAGDTENIGTYDYANTGTAQSFTGTDIVLTNNGLSATTNKLYRLTDVEDVFNTGTSSFDFSGLEFGDVVQIRLNATITTTSANQNVEIYLDCAQGTIANYQLGWGKQMFKTIGAHNVSNLLNFVYMGNTETINYPAQFKFTSDDDATILVNGFACVVHKRTSN